MTSHTSKVIPNARSTPIHYEMTKYESQQLGLVQCLEEGGFAEIADETPNDPDPTQQTDYTQDLDGIRPPQSSWQQDSLISHPTQSASGSRDSKHWRLRHVYQSISYNRV